MGEGPCVVLSHESALWYHRLAAAGLLSPANSAEAPDLADAQAGGAVLSDLAHGRLAISTEDLAARDVYLRSEVEAYIREQQPDDPLEALAYARLRPHSVAFPTPLHVLCGHAASRVWRGDVRAHLCREEPYEGAILRAGKGLYVVSPELALIQMARCLREEHLMAALITELSGTYALLPPDWVYVGRRGQDLAPVVGGRLRGDGYVDCAPLTSVENLAYLDGRLSGVHGLKLVHAALGASGDGSASPFETYVDVELQLARRRGGVGAGRGAYNARIDFDEVGRRLAGGRACAYADLLLTGRNGHRIDVEPGGVLGHAGREAMESDYRRRQAIERKRIEVIQVSWSQFRDLEAWDEICGRIALHLGKRRSRPTAEMRRMRSRVHADFCCWDCLRVFPPDRWRA